MPEELRPEEIPYTTTTFDSPLQPYEIFEEETAVRTVERARGYLGQHLGLVWSTDTFLQNPFIGYFWEGNTFNPADVAGVMNHHGQWFMQCIDSQQQLRFEAMLKGELTTEQDFWLFMQFIKQT